MIGAPLTPEEQTDLASVPVISCPDAPGRNLPSLESRLSIFPATMSGTLLAKTIRMHVIETVQKYGVGNCGPPGFYGTIGAFLCCQSALTVMNAVLQNNIMSLCVSCFAFLCDGPTERHIAQTTEITMLVGPVPVGLNSFGGLCAGSCVVIDLQLINGALSFSPPQSWHPSHFPPWKALASSSCGTCRGS